MPFNPEKRPENFTEAIYMEARMYGASLLRGSAIETMADKYNQELIGHGTTSVVIPDQTPDRVFAISLYPREQTIKRAAKTLAVQRMVQILWPNNFPAWDTYYVFEEEGDQIPGTVRQLIRGTHRRYGAVDGYSGSGFARDLREGLENNIKYPFIKVLQDCLDYNLPFVFDFNPKNFITSKEEAEYYIDEVTLKALGYSAGEAGISKFMVERCYQKPDLQAVRTCLFRLRQLGVL